MGGVPAQVVIVGGGIGGVSTAAALRAGGFSGGITLVDDAPHPLDRPPLSKEYLAGTRPLTDIAGEFTMMMANRKLDPGLETVFLMADESFSHVSSSLIKQIAPLADDEMLGRFVPAAIIPALRAKLR